jgi:hypothetical protein
VYTKSCSSTIRFDLHVVRYGEISTQYPVTGLVVHKTKQYAHLHLPETEGVEKARVKFPELGAMETLAISHEKALVTINAELNVVKRPGDRMSRRPTPGSDGGSVRGSGAESGRS